MKITILSILACSILSPLPAVAQFNVGLRAGLNLASADIDPSEFSTSPILGLEAGGIVEYELDGTISVQAEALFSQRGVEMTFEFLGEEQSSKAFLDYLAIAATLKYKFNEGQLRPYAFAGIIHAFNLSAEGESSDGDRDNLEDEIEATDLSLDVGAGIAFDVTPDIILMGDLHYAHGLQNIAAGVPFISSWKSRDVKFLAGVLFRI